MDIEKIIETLALYVFLRVVATYSSGPLKTIEKSYVESDGEEIRATLKINGVTKTYTYPIINLINQEEAFAILDQFYNLKAKKVAAFIDIIRLKGVQ